MSLRSDSRRQVSGWLVMSAYGLVSAVLQLVWLTYAPITTAAAGHYGVSEGAIGWLANVFPLLYVVLALPAGIVLDRWFRPTLGAGAALVAVGAGLRLFDDYVFVLAGHLVVAVAQPLVLNAISKLADGCLPDRQRPAGIAAAAAANLVGMLAALILGAAMGADGLRSLLLIDFGAALLAGAALWFGLRGQAPQEIDTPARVSAGALRALFTDRRTRSLGGLVFVGFGVFIALTTWLEPLLKPAGVTNAGTLLAVLVLSGIVGSAVLPAPVVHRGLERPALGATLLITASGCAALAIAPGMLVATVVVIVVGFPLLAALPIVLDTTERVVGAAGGSTGAAFIYLLGNAGGLFIAVAVEQLLGRPGWAFSLLALVVVGGFASLRSLGKGTDWIRAASPIRNPPPHRQFW
ncbi:MFS transporter [Actinokineospora xionganensis]|uniref:MFS transporter n=1 Tax=Actinokineospora xionganensis TaxID=2684470 RepID=A0ABR7LET7_9PSEU|nr:MFS transporter [Actinokineospora xionganensis]MBC6451211.1 MFS transporter [Actinokineospora xionganensis]